MKIDWNEENVATLQELWASHDPATVIAEKMGTTKGAIIGKANRLGLKARATGNVRRDQLPPSVAKVIVAIPVDKKKAASECYGDRIKSLAELEKHECLWPIGDPNDNDFGFCGAHSGRATYCKEHHAISFRKLPKKTKKLN